MLLISVTDVQVGPFALAHRVKGQHDVAETGQPLAAFLIRLVGLAVQAVAQLKQDSGKRAGRRGGDVKVRGNAQAGPALVTQFFESVTSALKAAGLLGLERRALGLASHEILESAADPRLPGAHIRGRLNQLQRGVAALVGIAGERRQIVGQATGIDAKSGSAKSGGSAGESEEGGAAGHS